MSHDLQMSAGPRCPDCGEGASEHRIGCKVLERHLNEREAARREQLDRIKARQAIATVQGHLEGYAAMVAKQPVCFAPLVDNGNLVDALREDAATLAAILNPPEGDFATGGPVDEPPRFVQGCCARKGTDA